SRRYRRFGPHDTGGDLPRQPAAESELTDSVSAALSID
ncbi:hypothetical protein AZ044_000736, partial [Pluralibacter gergoviae]